MLRSCKALPGQARANLHHRASYACFRLVFSCLFLARKPYPARLKGDTTDALFAIPIISCSGLNTVTSVPFYSFPSGVIDVFQTRNKERLLKNTLETQAGARGGAIPKDDCLDPAETR